MSCRSAETGRHGAAWRRALAAVVVAFASGVAAAADGDLAEISARVDAALADPGLGAVLRPAFASLDRTLARPDRPGLADEFAKLRAVSAKCAGTLAGDSALVAALGRAADVAVRSSLSDDDFAVARVAPLVESRPVRRSLDAAVRGARRAADAADLQLSGGDLRASLRSGGRAAVAYERARRVAVAAVARQDRRAPAWRIVLDAQGGALLSIVTGPGPSPDLFAVGATDGIGPLFLRGGGEGWVRLPTGTQGTLWWAAAVPGDGIWASGTSGQVVHYDPATGRIDDRSTGVPGTLYGLWGSGPGDVWAVGSGDGGPVRHALLHWDGAGWSEVAAPAEAANREIFKVWGRAADDVWACGLAGLLLHWDGVAWSSVPSGTDTTLLTVHGSAKEVVAVGAVTGAAIVERGAGEAFVAARVPRDAPSVAGVFVPPRGDAWAAGYVGTVLRRTGSSWKLIAGVPGSDGRDLHGVAVDGTGAVWIAGGDILSGTNGALLQYGPRRPAGDVAPRASFRTRVQPLLAARCATAGCHDGAPAARLSMATGADSLRGLVGARSAASPLLRVLPLRPSESSLVHLLEDDPGGGAPHGGSRLPLQDLLAIRSWILEGALDSE